MNKDSEYDAYINTDEVRVIDTETSIKNRGAGAIGTFKASPHSPQNRIEWFGSLNPKTNNFGTRKMPEGSTLKLCPGPALLVGQNIKFDLLYMMREPEFRELVMPRVKLWDTMHVEYLISGQAEVMPSLDKLAEKYGGTVKDDRLKEFWDNGIDTEDIDDSIIEPYLAGDLKNTSIVFLGQIDEVNRLGMMPLVKSQMDALLATTEMEYNGMYFAKSKALEEADLLRSELATIGLGVGSLMMRLAPKIDTPIITSAQMLSIVLFGGTLNVSVRVPTFDQGGNPKVYKSGAKKGQQVYKIEKQQLTMEGAGLNPSDYTTETKRRGIYIVNDDVLNRIKDERIPLTSKLCELVLDYRRISKDLSTYYMGYSALVWPHDQCIHPQYNHSITTTGRLSHSAPNLGNVSHNKEE